jgi:hypothetical protein
LLLSVAATSSAGGPASRLADAVRAGDQEGVRAQLKQAGQVNAREADGTVPLHWAARADHAAIADLLLRGGADANAADRYGVTPLMLAAGNGSAGMIERLVKAGANVNAALPEGQTILMTAARAGSARSAAGVVAHGADVNAHETWLGETALTAGGRRESWRRGQGSPWPEAPIQTCNRPRRPSSESRRTDGPTARRLHCHDTPAKGRSTPSAPWLAAGVDLNRGDPDGVTALILAVINAHYDVAALLIERGADPNVADSTGMTPLCRSRHEHAAVHARPSFGEAVRAAWR